jgi:hypothetical protein
MVDVDVLGRAIHAAKRVGGPWGPACSAWQVHPDFPGSKVMVLSPIEYDTDPNGEYDCECKSMAAHLIELMED